MEAPKTGTASEAHIEAQKKPNILNRIKAAAHKIFISARAKRILLKRFSSLPRRAIDVDEEVESGNSELDQVLSALDDEFKDTEDIEDEDEEEHEEDEGNWMSDPLPGWRPQAVYPYWEQFLHDDVRALLVPPDVMRSQGYWKMKMLGDVVSPTTLPEDGQCPICYDPYEAGSHPCDIIDNNKHLAVKVVCRGGHIIGSKCLQEWILSSQKEHCPMCRDPLRDVCPLKGRALPLESLQYLADVQAWFPMTYDRLLVELTAVYHKLSILPAAQAGLIRIHRYRERARILIRALSVHVPVHLLPSVTRQVAFDTLIESVETIRGWTPDGIEARNGVLLNCLYEVVYLFVKHSPDPVTFYFDLTGQDEAAMDKFDASRWIRELESIVHACELVEGEGLRIAHLNWSGRWLRGIRIHRLYLWAKGYDRFDRSRATVEEQNKLNVMAEKVCEVLARYGEKPGEKIYTLSSYKPLVLASSDST